MMIPPTVPLDAIRQPAVLYDAGGRIVAANDLAEALAGRPLTDLSAAKVAAIFDVRSPDGTPIPAEWLAAPRAIAGEESVDVPIAVTLPDGRRIEILATASPVREGGAVAGALVLWQDVTERKQAEEALRKSENDLRSIFARSLDALYRRDLSAGRSEYYSPAIEALTGFSVEECMAMGVDDVVDRLHPDDRQSVVSAKLGIPPESEGGTVDYRFLCKDGTYRWVSDRFRVERDRDGRPISREGIIRDINDRKLAEVALRESEGKYRALIETNADFIWEMDAAGQYTYCSPQMERLWGLAPEKMTGRTPFDLMPPDERERALAAFTEMASAPSGFSGLEMTSYDGRGQRIALEIAGLPFFGDDGALLGFRGTTRDVTERRRAEEALAESEADARSFFTNMVDACAICELVVDERGGPVDLRLVDVNPAFARTLSLPAELLIGQTAFMILPTLHREWLDLFLEVSRQRAFIQVEDPFPALDRRYHVTGFPVRNGRVAVVFRDITGQKA
ncbi:MAG: PAS domain-containing protein [Methanospirillum sp.]